MMNLKLQNISLAFTDVKLLSNISYTFLSSNIYILSGPSGVGKSTLLKVIAGFDEQKLLSDGQVKLGDNDYKRPSRKIFYVQQEDDLFEWMTVAEHLKYFIKLGADSKLCEEYLHKLELASAVNLYPVQLSYGMKRRLSILRAMVFQPDVLLLDETLSSLDSELRNNTLSVIEDYVLKNQKICIIVSHFPNDIGNLKNKILLKLQNAQLVLS
jgi:ABC-type multidrug transport system ATPase subunit